MPLVHASLITYFHSKVDNTSKIKETITNVKNSARLKIDIIIDSVYQK